MVKHTDSVFLRRDKCPICFCTKLISVYARSYDSHRIREYMELSYQGNVEYEFLEDQEFRIAECSSCRFLFQTNVLNETGAQRLYDVWIDPSLAEKWKQDQKRNMAFSCSILHFVNKHFSKTRPVRMLDYGAGFGEFSRLAKGYGFDVSALEFSQERASFLENLGLRPISPGKQERNYYHFIILSQVLEHLVDPLNVLVGVRESLHDDGLVFISVPNCRGLKRTLLNADSLPAPQFKEALLNCSALQHINCFTRATLHRILEKAGFKIVFRPFTFIGCSTFGCSPKETFKNIVRPFHYHFGTACFLRKAR